ncbi:Uma2 family endonuclease [Spirosoma pollinicola]|uniref:Uma2 family endonuclease n=1 Tax=Spirosoma pollinicola TaxID=2057025 RepID=A0A2K8Z0K4_9BACT|nr:Uma2 family endonuclease [Spirosoma pollinicola]AUD03420.1 Uma2 family endonuclease [Spirosoma pollinicola]
MEAVTEQSAYEQERGKPMPSKVHAYVQSNIIFELKSRYKDRFTFLSEISLDLNGWWSVPDLAIYPKMAIDVRQDEIRITTPPLCAIEIISPMQSLQELVDKSKAYFEHGAQSCWLVLPGLRSIYVFSSFDDFKTFTHTDTLLDDTLKISIPLAEVFA